ncbi:glycoside hydrolase family 28 protein [Paenibacillus doosanensis]|uniref:Endo-polygalacturonase n=1 Tax=Paenibacillus konkukensis TaxID=2020716 RepID=A0ABY4RQV9_9BACL|nr:MULTISPECIES: glycoside hydrolase family 28 protein [Paenibacillus]MCS7459025.1 glycoside hydrolase family 28 protein [Paenibacillus doosanensis]UQZ84079.1 Endo-polygalacturonase precursor [Paenibacillus konkukensis]
MRVNVRDYGAVGDGRVKDTAAIQAAIDDCHRQGGGTVVVPQGQYLSGTLLIQSNVNLHLEAAARIVSSMEEQDFAAPQSSGSEQLFYSEGQGKNALICARHAERVSITGPGTIDGRGEHFLEPEDGVSDYVLLPLGGFRPKLIDFEGCTDVLFRDVTLYRASSWGLHMTGCSRVNIHGIKILGQQRGPNNDGIDPDCCKDVHISDCHIETGDDCIVVKTTKTGAERYGSCENITVTNCTLVTHDSAVKIGTETHADIRNIVVSNCVIRNSNRGLGLWVRDGATVENILFSNIIIETRLFSDAEETSRELRWWGKGEPIFITAERRKDSAQAPGIIRNIRFDHISVEAEGGVYLEGSEDSVIENISVRGLKLAMRVKSGYPGGLFDTQPSARGVFPHHVPAVFCRHAKNVSLDDVEVVWQGEPNTNWSNAMYGEHIERLSLRGFRGRAAKEGENAVALKSVSGISVEGCKAERGTEAFLSLENVDAEELFVAGNDFAQAKTAVRFADGTSPEYFAAANRMPKQG